MGFSCRNKTSLPPSILNYDNRDLGLSNIYNVNTDVEFCVEKFNSPLYYISGATKPYENVFSGCTDSNGDGIYSGSTFTLGCPSGFNLNPEKDGCISTVTTGATSGATFYTATSITPQTSYGSSGAIFFQPITDLPLPIQFKFDSTSPGIVDATDDPSPYPADTFNVSGNSLSNYGVVSNSLWGVGSTITGRMNNAGLWASPSPSVGEFVGFSQCIDIPVGGLYHIAMGSDNYLRFRVNGETVVIYERPSGSANVAFNLWHVFPFYLNSGKNIIEMEAANAGGVAGFAAEIYSASTGTLTAATTTSELGIVFTTNGLSGGLYEIGDSSGFSCPSGFSLDNCSGGTPFCTQIIHTGLTSGTTVIDCDGLHNVSINDSFDLNFTITGGTDYTGYTGQFCYKLINSGYILSGDTNYLLDNNLIENGVPIIYEKCFDFSGLTSTTITDTIFSGVDVPIEDNDYRLISYVKFYPENCTEDEINLSLLDPPLVEFNYSDNWFFTTLSNPPTPIFSEIVGTFVGGSLRTDTITVLDGQRDYQLSVAPNGGVAIVNVNGITLTDGLDYTLDFSLLPTGNVIITFNEDLEVDNDIVTVTYITPGDPTQIIQTNTDLFSIESLIVTGFTTGTTASTINIVNINTVDGIKEFFTQYDYVPGSSLKVSINGIELTDGIEYFSSNKTANKINFHPTTQINIGDVITVWYFRESAILKEGDLGKLDSNDVNIRWYITENLTSGTTGDFLVEITEYTDLNYSGVTYSGTTDYVEDTLSYNLLFEDIETDKKYIYRVCMNKQYTNITNDVLETTSCSNNGSFDLTSGNAIYNNI